MPFKNLLKKKDKIQDDGAMRMVPDPTPAGEKLPQASEFTFMRTDTNTQSLIAPPHYDSDDVEPEPEPEPTSSSQTTPKKRFGRFRGLSQGSAASGESTPPKEHKRLSQRLHLGHKKSDSGSSVNLPSDLPVVADAYSVKGDEQEKEAKWEERATILGNARPTTPVGKTVSQPGPASPAQDVNRPQTASDAVSDTNIQEAIRLHENGDLEAATVMFHTLAEQGNVLSQVLYGLSLRHGWGCKPDLERAVQYLSSAASNSAVIESEALRAGLRKGGAAKGELVLAIFELGNCFRYGWGVNIDKVAARQYYETAANLGDTDAMNEAAWCYLEGFGGKKDKFKAAQLLRLAEKNGSKTLGNTWIWKEKYSPK